MSNRFFKPAIIPVLLASSAIVAGIVFAQEAKPKKNDEKSYMPVVIDKDFETIHKDDATQTALPFGSWCTVFRERVLKATPIEVAQRVQQPDRTSRGNRCHA